MTNKKLGLINKESPPYICMNSNLVHVASIEWGETEIMGKAVPPIRMASGDLISACIDIPRTLIVDGTYNCRSPIGWINQLMFLTLCLFPTRIRNIQLHLKTQSHAADLDIRRLFDKSLSIQKIVILGGTSSANVVSRCKWGNYLIQGFLSAGIEIRTELCTLTGEVDHTTFRCLNEISPGFL